MDFSDLKLNFQPKRILICGYGSIGKSHFHVFSKMLPGATIRFLRGSSSLHSNSNNNIELGHFYYSSEIALEWNPELIIIATPATDHLGKIVLFANKKIPILVEKPLLSGLESKKKINELMSLNMDHYISVAYVLRHDPCCQTFKENLLSGAIGSIIECDFYCGSWLPDWRPSSDYRETVSSQFSLGGGVLNELSHEIDLARYIFGQLRYLTSVIRTSGCLSLDVEDHAFLILANDLEVPISFRLNFCSFYR